MWYAFLWLDYADCWVEVDNDRSRERLARNWPNAELIAW